MIIVTRPNVTSAELDHIRERVETLGLRTHVSRGEQRTIIGCIGDEALVQEAALLALSDKFRGPEGQARFNLLLDRLTDQVHDLCLESVAAGERAGLDRWAQAWSKLAAMPGRFSSVTPDPVSCFPGTPRTW